MSHTYRSFAVVVITTLLMLVAGVSTALAFHIPGATYTGTHSAGGTVSFRVSLDGNSIRNFRVEDYETEFCIVDFIEHGAGTAIVNNAFSFNSSLLEIAYSGSFPGIQLAQGTFADTECGTGTLTWTARTTASPAGSAECIAAQGPATEAEAALAAAQARVQLVNGKLIRSAKQVKNAKRAVTQAARKNASPQAKQKTRKRLRAATKKQAQSGRELQQAKNGRTQAESVLAQAQAAKTAVCGPGV